MSAVIRKGGWKLIRNWGVGMETRAGAQLFKLYHEDGSVNDLGEQHDLAATHPKKRDELLSELNGFLKETKPELPYRNPAMASPEDRASIPGVLARGAEEDRVWVEFEAVKGKNCMEEALLLYTLNPIPMDATKGHRNEWFAKPARLSGGRAESTMPPGATHAVFCLRDSAGFQVVSEPVPSCEAKERKFTDPEILKDGYAYRPGLFSLIKFGKKAVQETEQSGVDAAPLREALTRAEAIYASAEVNEKEMVPAIVGLRAAIRNTRGTAAAAHPLMNRFPTDPRF